MKKSLFLSLAVVAGMTLGAAERKNVSLATPAELNGTQLKPGEYRLEVAGDKVVISQGKQRVEAPVRVEQGDSRYETTMVLYNTTNGKNELKEIRLGGTNRRILFGAESSGL